MVAIVEVVRFGFGFGYAGHGNSGPHGDRAVRRKLDRINREFGRLSSAKDATDNPLMMKYLPFGHGGQTSVKTWEQTGTL
jgi:hypothetical protein